MTGARAARRTLRRLARPLVGAFLALSGILAPVEGPDLPRPLDGLVGAAPAHAQTPPLEPDTSSGWVTDGVPSPCPVIPVPWSPVAPVAPDHPDYDDEAQAAYETASECVLELPACPESRLIDHDDELAVGASLGIGRIMALSSQYPNFCEESVARADDTDLYDECTNERGVAVLAADGTCRLVHPAVCSDGMHRITASTCRAVQRRTWTCEAGFIPRNDFNSCYRPPPAYTDNAHPACGPGAPEFRLGSCEEYVGQDFFRDPTSNRSLPGCGDFDTGDLPSAMQQSRNDYWCEYVPALLNVACHGPDASCDSESSALCVKRASRTGGCDSIAHTIRCRALQAAFADESMTAAEVYSQGCQPCTTIPFEPVPAACPGNLSAQPHTGQFADIHRVKEDFQISAQHCIQSVGAGGPITDACRALPKCADPPRGRLTWTTTHESRVAVVNSPTILTVLDTPSGRRNRRYYRHNTFSRASPLRLDTSTTIFTTYPGAVAPEAVAAVRLWPQPQSSARSFDDLVDDGECTFRDFPRFKAIVEELWPDDPDHYDEIERLFGADALDWWDDLPAVQRPHRTELLQQEVDCHSGPEAWCRWTPVRSGYYRIKAAGAWLLKLWEKRVGIDPDPLMDHQDGYFNNLRAYLQIPENRAAIQRDLECTPSSPPNTCTILEAENAAEMGLTNDLTDILPLPAGDWAYEDPGTYQTECPPIDVRFTCGSGEVANYTETEYIGIQVYEVRVSTVAPSR